MAFGCAGIIVQLKIVVYRYFFRFGDGVNAGVAAAGAGVWFILVSLVCSTLMSVLTVM